MKPKEEFFEEIKKENIELTFADVRLKTHYSKVVPSEVDLASKASRRVKLRIPIISAAMDTVTEYEMAIAMAKLGGLGIIHKNLSPEEQAEHVRWVKRRMNGLTGLIKDPVCINTNQTVAEINKMIDEKGYHFRSFPVLDPRTNRLVGIISGRDLDIENIRSTKKIENIMTTGKDLVRLNEGIDKKTIFSTFKETKKSIIPVVNKNKEVVGIYSFKDIINIKKGYYSECNLDEDGRLVVGAAIGVNKKETFKRLDLLVQEGVDVVAIDTAHADSKNVIDILKEIKKNKKYSNIDVIAGNVSEPEAVERLIKAGADGIKVGQGPGSICTTRIKTGVGRPQVSAVYWCARKAFETNPEIPICADGGITSSGDIVIALAAGAYNVMLGGMLAGTDQTPSEAITLSNGQRVMVYRGMGSAEAMAQHKGSRERYNQSDKFVAEGVSDYVPYKGDVERIVFECVGGLRSGMGYLGAKDIEALRNEPHFMRITNAGFAESHPHHLLGIGGDSSIVKK